MLEPTQEHQHLPNPQITPNMVEVRMSNITHYKKLEARHCETIFLNDSTTQELLQTQIT